MAAKRSKKASPEPERFAHRTSVPDTTGVRLGRWSVIAVRLMLGWMMIWAFLDKTFGLGIATSAERAWLAGGSPTAGYLAGADGIFAGVFNALSGVALVDWLFMLGLLGVGISFFFGVATRIGGISGALMVFFMYLAALPLANNPIVDDHLVYAVLFVAIGFTHHVSRFDVVREWWLSLPFVRNNPWLE